MPTNMAPSKSERNRDVVLRCGSSLCGELGAGAGTRVATALLARGPAATALDAVAVVVAVVAVEAVDGGTGVTDVDRLSRAERAT